MKNTAAVIAFHYIYCLHIFAVNYDHFLRTNGRQVLSIRRDDKIPKNMQVKHFSLDHPIFIHGKKINNDSNQKISV